MTGEGGPIIALYLFYSEPTAKSKESSKAHSWRTEEKRKRIQLDFKGEWCSLYINYSKKFLIFSFSNFVFSCV